MLVQQLSPSMREVAFDQSRSISSANDGKVTSLERKSQLESDDIATVTDAVNSVQQVVASVKQVLGEAGMTTAFTQPLIRKMEL